MGWMTNLDNAFRKYSFDMQSSRLILGKRASSCDHAFFLISPKTAKVKFSRQNKAEDEEEFPSVTNRIVTSGSRLNRLFGKVPTKRHPT